MGLYNFDGLATYFEVVPTSPSLSKSVSVNIYEASAGKYLQLSSPGVRYVDVHYLILENIKSVFSNHYYPLIFQKFTLT